MAYGTVLDIGRWQSQAVWYSLGRLDGSHSGPPGMPQAIFRETETELVTRDWTGGTDVFHTTAKMGCEKLSVGSCHGR